MRGHPTHLDVRIVDLAPMRVAKARAHGTAPEPEAWKQLASWAQQRGLVFPGHHRFFGFDDPPPSGDTEHYGYQQWMTVGPEPSAGDGVTVEVFPGGRYAVTHCEGLAVITERWQELVGWVTRSDYEWRADHELEELLNPDAGDSRDFVFDLYLPIELD